MKQSQIEAAKAGQKRFQGKPCQYGHPGVRYTTSGQCVECCELLNQARREKIRRLLKGAAG